MTRPLESLDISNLPELLALARAVRETNEPRMLRAGDEDLAVIEPAKPKVKRKRSSRGKPYTMDDPLWDIVGIGSAEQATDVSRNKDKYLAEAYLSNGT